jgi:WD40 repeat protein
MGSRLTQPATAATKMTLTPVMTLQSQKDYRWTHFMAYFLDGKRIISASSDKTIRQWDLQAGKEIEKVQDVHEGNRYLAAVTRDGRWVMTSSGDEEYNSRELKACEVETGIVKTFQDSRVISCVDISTDGKLLASGSMDSTVLIWGMDTGKLVAGPFESDDYVGAIRFSPDSKKLAVESHTQKCLEVWDVHTQKLDARVGKFRGGTITSAPMFWTKKGTILAAFSFDFDDNHSEPTTIYEFDASTLETVGDPFEGHTEFILDLALSFDGTLLASYSFDKTIKLWSLEPRQLLASFHFQHNTQLSNLIFSPDTRQLAYWADDKIFICNIPPDILASIKLALDARAIVRTCCIYLLIDALISSSRHLTIQPPMTHSKCTPHCFIHSHY